MTRNLGSLHQTLNSAILALFRCTKTVINRVRLCQVDDTKRPTTFTAPDSHCRRNNARRSLSIAIEN